MDDIFTVRIILDKIIDGIEQINKNMNYLLDLVNMVKSDDKKISQMYLSEIDYKERTMIIVVILTFIIGMGFGFMVHSLV